MKNTLQIFSITISMSGERRHDESRKTLVGDICQHRGIVVLLLVGLLIRIKDTRWKCDSYENTVILHMMQ